MRLKVGPGVLVTAPSGQPGAGQTIRIRGFGSFSNSNDALYVVDGIPISGDLSSINTSDIESISILKDAVLLLCLETKRQMASF
jgi:outer membrane receptor protein involved in Fe transport